ncbi:MAG: CocE/NonD family hydrolase [Acidobacteria bacterium]|nr:CocE/NonD family hydrolase [Acidobacteriota bacterium]
MRRGAGAASVVVVLLVIALPSTLPYVDALAFIARAADLPGMAATLAEWREGAFTRSERFDVATRYGAVAGRLYRPQAESRRAVTLVPGVHMDGIDETRLVGMAEDLARTGYTVLTVAPPNLTRFRITPENTDIIEDAATWLSSQAALAPDGRVGMLGISFSGGLSVVAAGRPGLRSRVAFVMSFGGHGDLPRVMRYLCSGAPLARGQRLPRPASVEGMEHLSVQPPHDYGVAVVLLTLADRVVPPDQVEPLRRGVTTFLTASSLTLVDTTRAEEEFAKARTYALERPVFLLHGVDDTVIPASETVLLASHLEHRASVRALLSGLITHAEVDRGASAAQVWQLAGFWRALMRH